MQPTNEVTRQARRDLLCDLAIAAVWLAAIVAGAWYAAGVIDLTELPKGH